MHATDVFETGTDVVELAVETIVEIGTDVVELAVETMVEIGTDVVDFALEIMGTVLRTVETTDSSKSCGKYANP